MVNVMILKHQNQTFTKLLPALYSVAFSLLLIDPRTLVQASATGGTTISDIGPIWSVKPGEPGSVPVGSYSQPEAKLDQPGQFSGPKPGFPGPDSRGSPRLTSSQENLVAGQRGSPVTVGRATGSSPGPKPPPKPARVFTTGPIDTPGEKLVPTGRGYPVVKGAAPRMEC